MSDEKVRNAVRERAQCSVCLAGRRYSRYFSVSGVAWVAVCSLQGCRGSQMAGPGALYV